VEMTIEQKRALAITRARMRAAAEAEQTQRAVSGMSDQQLAAEAYEQPEPPPGVTINTATGPVYHKGGGNFIATNEAEAFQRAMRERDGRSGDVAGALLRGVPFAGPFTSRAVAGTKALMGEGEYADNLQNEQARDNTYDADFPVESGALKVTGAVASSLYPGLLAAKGAGLMAAGGRTLLGTGGTTLPGVMARGGVAGALQGAAQGAGDTKDLTNVGDTVRNVGQQGVVGALLGSAIPATISVAGRGIDAVRNRGKDALSSVSNKSREWLLSQLNPSKVTAMRDEMRRLGPLAVPADVSAEFAGIAGAAANRPGTKDAVVRALVERDAGKNARINSTLRTELGSAKSPLTVDGEIKQAFDAISPEYEALWPKAKAVDTSALAQKLEAMAIDKRGAGAAAAEDVRKMLNVRGTDQLDPNPRTLHEVRKAIDGMSKATQNTAERDVLKEARRAIDEELAAKVPGIKAVDSKWADVARQEEAFAQGRTIFRGGEEPMWPDELAAIRDRATQPAGTAQGPATRATLDRLEQGTRAKLEEIVGLNANDVTALNRLLKGEGDWNRQKLVMQFGKDKAERMLQVLDAESVFQTTKQGAVDNSKTAGRVAFNKFLDEAETPPPGIMDGVDLMNAPFRIPKNIKERLTKDATKAKAEQAVKELASLSVAQGPQADAIVQALMTRSQRSSALKDLYAASGVGTSVAPYAGNAIVDALMERRKANAGRK
jgi:hypothetical protein